MLQSERASGKKRETSSESEEKFEEEEKTHFILFFRRLPGLCFLFFDRFVVVIFVVVI